MEVVNVTYFDLTQEQRKEAMRLVENHLNQIEDEWAREQNREPIYYPLTSETFREHLKTAEFEIKVDEVTRKEELVLI